MHDQSCAEILYLQRSEMDNAVDVRMFLEDLVQCLLVCDIDIVVARLLAADALYPVQGFCRGVVEVVDNDDFIACFEQGKGCEGADVASAT
jgi:hypothetical protein